MKREETLVQPLAGQRAPSPARAPADAIRAKRLPDGICLLTFDRPDSSANILDRATMAELDRHLERIAAEPAIRAVVFQTAKPAIFIAGADLRELGDPKLSEDELRNLVLAGQRLFDRIAALKAVTVAAIHGACVGGGCELSLACDYRVASEDLRTRIGLPETTLGIIPAWGGSTRLPRLIGLPGALDVILRGRRLSSRDALRRGIVDGLAPRECLLDDARRLIARGKPRRRKHWFVNSPLFAAAAALTQKRKILAQTRGNYPAIPRALKVLTRGVWRRPAASLAMEAAAVTDLARTDASRNLVRLFFLQDKARKLSAHPTSERPEIRSVAVIGAGVMGSGIAQWLGAKGFRVLLNDVSPERAAAGLAAVSRLCAVAVRRRIMTPLDARQALDRVTPCHTGVPLANVDLVIEAATEKLELKRSIFQQLGRTAGPRTMLATNTSALPVAELAVCCGRPSKVAGLHFFNPVHAMPLVEVVRPDGTDPAVIEACLRFVRQIGKFPVVVRDAPGFLVNRLLMPYLVEAVRLFEQGSGTREIDEAMLDFGMPMGPLRLIDEIGVDVAGEVAAYLSGEFRGRLPLPPLLDALKKAGHLGRKSGAGFHIYAKGHEPDEANPDVLAFAGPDRVLSLGRDALQERMVLPIINEAARCLAEHVAASADDVDFAMVQGTGFAPFRGGPLRYADRLGVPKVVASLTRLAAEHGPSFAPCDALKSLAEDGATFHAEA